MNNPTHLPLNKAIFDLRKYKETGFRTLVANRFVIIKDLGLIGIVVMSETYEEK